MTSGADAQPPRLHLLGALMRAQDIGHRTSGIEHRGTSAAPVPTTSTSVLFNTDDMPDPYEPTGALWDAVVRVVQATGHSTEQAIAALKVRWKPIHRQPEMTKN